MNFEVFCFNWVDAYGDGNESLQIVQKEYFDAYEEAEYFEDHQTEYESVSITPMNREAEMEIREKCAYLRKK